MFSVVSVILSVRRGGGFLMFSSHGKLVHLGTHIKHIGKWAVGLRLKGLLVALEDYVPVRHSHNLDVNKLTQHSQNHAMFPYLSTM